MSRRSAPIYPAYAFNESRTWFNWVKLTASDVFRLREEHGFEGQNIYFRLNHPIRYVCLTGLIVSIEDMKNRYTLVELDDGSGAVITVKITRVIPEEETSANHLWKTTVPNVGVIAKIGRYDVLVDGFALEIGTVVKVKGTISAFRNIRQLELRRIWVLRSTIEECDEWAEAAKFKAEVLSQPWIVSRERLKELQAIELDKRTKKEDAEKLAEQKRKLEAAKKVKRAQRKKEHDARKEVKRKKEEELMNAGALI